MVQKGSGTFVQSTLRAVPAKVPDPFLNHNYGAQPHATSFMPRIDPINLCVICDVDERLFREQKENEDHILAVRQD